MWTGGGADCDHQRPAMGDPDRPRALTGKGVLDLPQSIAYKDICGRCGARREDSQLGLEASPDQYVERMVAVFREVWRVLRDDGTVWLNLAPSFVASSARLDAPLRDTAGTAPQGSPDPGSVYPDLCDGCAAVLGNRTEHNIQLLRAAERPSSPTDRDTSRTGSGPAPLASSPLGAQASTTPRSSQPPPVECSHCANCDACLSLLASSTRDARLCARKAASTNGTGEHGSADHSQGMDASGTAWLKYISGKLKPKDMAPIPWMVVMALIADGWYFRGDIIWAKKNCMPESVTDRPTRSHEYLFLLAKQPRYFMDMDAIREGSDHPHLAGKLQKVSYHDESAMRNDGASVATRTMDRNRRSVWTIPTQPMPDAHFATFPEELVRPCILAGTSERGECSACGAPWQREVEKVGEKVTHVGARYPSDAARTATPTGPNGQYRAHGAELGTRERIDQGWRASCTCQNQSEGSDALEAPDGSEGSVRSQTVLDPFIGSGTTALVARKHGRRCIGIDLSESYLDIAARRLQQLSLFAEPA